MGLILFSCALSCFHNNLGWNYYRNYSGDGNLARFFLLQWLACGARFY